MGQWWQPLQVPPYKIKASGGDQVLK